MFFSRRIFLKAGAAVLAALLSFSISAQTITYYHSDYLGSPKVATNSAGDAIWTAGYRAYGTMSGSAVPSGNDTLLFAGKSVRGAGSAPQADYYYYMRGRYYDSEIGRFLSVDPVGLRENNIHSFNRYAYANNNPYKYVDPDGREPVTASVLFTAGVVGLGVAYQAIMTPERKQSIIFSLNQANERWNNWWDNIIRSDGAGEPRAGESGGPGAGKDFGERTKDDIRDRDGNKCVFCKKDTTREPGPDQSNIDHADPKADGGNNTPNNGQNTCRTCNLDKGRRTTGEFLESGGRRFPPQYGGQP